MTPPARGIRLLAEAREGLFEALDPDTLRTCHEDWAADADAFGPWTPITTQPLGIVHKSSRIEFETLVCGTCSSSFDVARWAIEKRELNPWDGVLAVRQNQGRGQRGRSWISPAGNLYGSLYWPALPPKWQTLIPLITGLCCAKVLESKGLSPSLKWPNDILMQGRKVGGILVEDRGGDVLMGLGMNLVSAPDDALMRAHRVLPAGKLSDHGVAPRPLTLWGEIVREIRLYVEALDSHTDTRPLLESVEKRLTFLGERVVVRDAGEDDYEATILGLNEFGGLRIRRSDEERVLYSANVFPV